MRIWGHATVRNLSTIGRCRIGVHRRVPVGSSDGIGSKHRGRIRIFGIFTPPNLTIHGEETSIPNGTQCRDRSRL